MSHSTFQFHKESDGLLEAVRQAVDLSNTHHRVADYDLTTRFTQLLCQARTAWEAILAEIDDIVEELPEHEFASKGWITDYQRLATVVADGMALLICAEYVKGRALLEGVYNPLQNLHATMANTVWSYEHA